MFGNSRFDRVRRMFADQFEPDGQDFLYRRHLKRAPVRVSAAEHDRLIATFNSFINYASLGITGGIVVLMIATAAYAATAKTELPVTALYVGMGAIMLAFLASYYWAWDLPVRELRGRTPIGEPRSRAEISRLVLARISYGQIATAAGLGLVLLPSGYAHGRIFSGWHLFWNGLGAAVLVASAIQAFRKWRSESQKPPA